MRECKHCENVIDDPDTAVYDGAYWFCDSLCQQKYAANLDPMPQDDEGPIKGRYDR